jgi:hypothetical protein
MYLFTRRARILAGGYGEASAWAVHVTEKARQVTGLDITLWTGVLGPGVGSLAWSTAVPDLSSLETATDKLLVDAGYLDLLDQGRAYVPEGADDQIAQILHPSDEILAAATGEVTYANVVESACTAGNLGRGLEVGVRIAEKATELAGHLTMFLVGSTGRFGGVAWITGYPDIAAMESAEQRIFSDPEFIALVDEGAGAAYDAAGTTQLVYRKLV